MRLIFIQPAVGRRKNGKYLKGWQMEPLPLAALAGLCPPGVEKICFDDRVERIDFDVPADAVMIPIETYTARRSYEIAGEYRKRGVPVICGGFHATLNKDEVTNYAEAVVIGEAEPVWAELLDDIGHKTLKRFYQGCAANGSGTAAADLPDRGIYAGKRYLPLNLLEAGRGCGNCCDFCSIQAFFGPRYRRRPTDAVLAELRSLPAGRLIFFVDDNFTADVEGVKELLRAMIPLHRRWVTQMSIHAAHDEELLDLLRRAGCQAVLIGFESLSPETLREMKKSFNAMSGGYEKALNNLRRYNIRLYATFVFGYDADTLQTFDEVFTFAMEQEFYVAAFSHLMPFPGTPLYRRLEQEGRLLYPAWWLDSDYRFSQVPFHPRNMSSEELSEKCMELRRRFYSLRNILARINTWNCGSPFLGLRFLPVNLLQKFEASKRFNFPLGDENWTGTILKARR
jgi:radical SAM superfamily enzyme YgiQ (UPF0313 family)